VKYFTKELWLSWNTEHDEESAKRNNERSRKIFADYEEQLKAVLPRIGDEYRTFYLDESLHDGRLLSFTTGDAIDFDLRSTTEYDINATNSSVRIRVLHHSLNQVFILNYSSIRRVVFDYPSDAPLFHFAEGWHIGDWGYDELTIADENYLRHEVLFSSGTSIVIEFKDFSFEKIELERKP